MSSRKHLGDQKKLNTEGLQRGERVNLKWGRKLRNEEQVRVGKKMTAVAAVVGVMVVNIVVRVLFDCYEEHAKDVNTACLKSTSTFTHHHSGAAGAPRAPA
jgi:hypothetical protein